MVRNFYCIVLYDILILMVVLQIWYRSASTVGIGVAEALWQLRTVTKGSTNHQTTTIMCLTLQKKIPTVDLEQPFPKN